MTQEKGKRMANIDKLQDFDYDLKTLKERKKHVENLISENYDIIERYTEESGNKISQERFARNLERLGTYLIRSSDIESPKSIPDYSFYREYYDLYSKTVTVDEKGLKPNGETTKVKKQRVETYSPQEDEYIFNQGNGESKAKIDKWKLFDFTKMNSNHKSMFIKTCLRGKDDEKNEMKEEYKETYEYLLSLTKDDKDIAILDMSINGKTQMEIAKKIGISQPAVVKRFKKIVEEM